MCTPSLSSPAVISIAARASQRTETSQENDGTRTVGEEIALHLARVDVARTHFEPVIGALAARRERPHLEHRKGDGLPGPRKTDQ